MDCPLPATPPSVASPASATRPLLHPRSLPVLSAASSLSSRLPVLSAIPPNPPHRSLPCCRLHPLPATMPSTFSSGSVARLLVPPHHPHPPTFPFSPLFHQTLHADRTLGAAFTHCRRLRHLPPCPHPPLVLFILPLVLSSSTASTSVAFPFPSSSFSVHLPRSKPRKTLASSISPPAPTPSALPSEPTPTPSLLAYTITPSSPLPSSPPTRPTVSHPLLGIGHSGVLWSRSTVPRLSRSAPSLVSAHVNLVQST